MRLFRFAVLLLLATATTVRADVFRLLDDNQQAAQARVDLFQQATTEIDALYFLARNDRITLAALALLRDAHRRGVPNVRLIVDANFEHIPKSVLAYLRDEGVQVKVYHPLTLRHPLWVFYRMHEKVIVADRARYITGGRNLAEDYFGLRKRNFVDRDVYVEGASAAEAERHFENLWSSRHVADLKFSVSPDAKRNAEKLLNGALEDLQRGGFVRLDTNTDWSAGQKQVATEFLHDPTFPNAGPRVGVRLTEVLEKAQQSIVLESPYFVPSRALLQLLDRKCAEGVHVTVVTNSMTSNDGLLPYVAYLKYRRHLVRSGVDLREFKGPDCLHAKSAVIDGHLALVGSYNIDPRSENLNTEVMSVADDESVASELLAAIESHAVRSWQIGARRERIRPSRALALRMWAARMVLPFVEGQL
jgi:cardiolipin synthase C